MRAQARRLLYGLSGGLRTHYDNLRRKCGVAAAASEIEGTRSIRSAGSGRVWTKQRRQIDPSERSTQHLLTRVRKYIYEAVRVFTGILRRICLTGQALSSRPLNRTGIRTPHI